MHGISHEGVVLYGVWSLNLLALISVEQHVMGWANRVHANACVALLSLLVLGSFMCVFLHHDSRWRQLSFY